MLRLLRFNELREEGLKRQKMPEDTAENVSARPVGGPAVGGPGVLAHAVRVPGVGGAAGLERRAALLLRGLRLHAAEAAERGDRGPLGRQQN